MNNVFPLGFQIHYKFDLKGSTVNREVSEEKRHRPGSTWKDKEFAMKRYVRVGPQDWTALERLVQDDTDFLAGCDVMDYSLMVGIHKFKDDPESAVLHPRMGEKIEVLRLFVPDKSSGARYAGNDVIIHNVSTRRRGRDMRTHERAQFEIRRDLRPREGSFRYMHRDQPRLMGFCGGLRATNDADEPLSEIYFMGIIDFLQKYTARKKAEHAMKRLAYAEGNMSCVPPAMYSARMLDFVRAHVKPPERGAEGTEEGDFDDDTVL